MLENLSLVALFVSAVENSKLGNNFTCYAFIFNSRKSAPISWKQQQNNQHN